MTLYTVIKWNIKTITSKTRKNIESNYCKQYSSRNESNTSEQMTSTDTKLASHQIEFQTSEKRSENLEFIPLNYLNVIRRASKNQPLCNKYYVTVLLSFFITNRYTNAAYLWHGRILAYICQISLSINSNGLKMFICFYNYYCTHYMTLINDRPTRVIMACQLCYMFGSTFKPHTRVPYDPHSNCVLFLAEGKTFSYILISHGQSHGNVHRVCAILP